MTILNPNRSRGRVAAQQRDVIVISEFLVRHSKANRTGAPAYSRALRRTKGVVQRVDLGTFSGAHFTGTDMYPIGQSIILTYWRL